MPRTPINDVIRKAFRKPPIMVGEDPAEYEQLKELVLAQEDPENLQQVMFVQDIVNAEWEIGRLLGLKPAILHAVIPHAIRSQIAASGDAVPFDEKLVPVIRKHVNAMLAGQKEARQELERALQDHQLTLDTIIATAFTESVRSQVYADRMLEAAFARRNVAYAELGRLRAHIHPKLDAKLGAFLDDLDREEARAGNNAAQSATANTQAPAENGTPVFNGH